MVPSQTAMLAVRSVHLLALAVALGGAVLLWLADDVPPPLARRYEFAFWAAVGLLAVTGVGNAGALAPAIPGPDTRWGALFAAKLGAVGLLVAFSLVRTGLVARLAPARAPRGRWYALTAGWVAAVVALAVVMVRG